VDEIGLCPIDPLFVPGPNLDIPGHGWIPRTFLNQGAEAVVNSGTIWGCPTREGMFFPKSRAGAKRKPGWNELYQVEGKLLEEDNYKSKLWLVSLFEDLPGDTSMN